MPIVETSFEHRNINQPLLIYYQLLLDVRTVYCADSKASLLCAIRKYTAFMHLLASAPEFD